MHPEFNGYNILEVEANKYLDLPGFIRYFVNEGLQIAKSLETPQMSPEQKSGRLRFTVSFLSAGILKRRQEAGLSMEPNDLMHDEYLHSVVEEFVTNEADKITILQGLADGYAVAGLIPLDYESQLQDYLSNRDSH